MNTKKNYHDADFIGLQYTRAERRLTLDFQLVTGELAVVCCEEVSVFRLGEMGLQNVTSRLLISSEREFQPNDIRERINWAASREGWEYTMTDEQAEHFIIEIRQQKLTVLVLEPSIGAELVVVCKSLEHVA
ncbi:hypothetical protein [Caballeronia sp. LjRoot31]|jgi:hypothetical protein|uniref:hypothetical protein n=1 Tax=Caballeronia sp. LjRoot31 TaxID=3342324 RepID=UPI003ED09774